MRTPKLLTDYSALPVEQVSPTAHRVVVQTTQSTYISNGDKVAKPVLDAVTTLDQMVENTPNPTPSQNKALDGLRAAVRRELGKLGKQLNLDYGGNAPALLSSGLPLADASSERKPVDVPPTDVELLDAPKKGCLLLKFKRPARAVVTLIRYTTDPTLPEDQWHVAVGGGRQRLLGAFAKGTEVWVKVAGLSSSTMDPVYSAVISRIVQ